MHESGSVVYTICIGFANLSYYCEELEGKQATSSYPDLFFVLRDNISDTEQYLQCFFCILVR
jgi:hypothetical protein